MHRICGTIQIRKLIREVELLEANAAISMSELQIFTRTNRDIECRVLAFWVLFFVCFLSNSAPKLIEVFIISLRLLLFLNSSKFKIFNF